MNTKHGPRVSSEQDGAKALLKEVTDILNLTQVNFVVVGGWVPFLFHSTRFGHPGTFDVDLLIHGESLENGTFDSAGDILIERGYLRAPKNRFQAHRIIHVAEERMVFHVDFLNEQQPTNELELVEGKGKLQSIYTPSMQAIFKYEGYRFHPEFERVRFPSVETFLVTKAAAVSSKKRSRDAFDAFVSVMDQDPAEFASRWKSLTIKDGLFVDANDALIAAIDSGDAIPKVMRTLSAVAGNGSPTEVAIRRAFDFLVRTGGANDLDA